MKKQIRFTLLFALALALLMGTFAIVSFAAPGDPVQLRILTLKENSNSTSLSVVSDYGTVSVNGVEQENPTGTILYDGESGSFELTAIPNTNYRFVRWQNGAGVQITSLTTTVETNESITLYAVFAPEAYDILYVGANSTDSFYQDYFTEIYDLNDHQNCTTYAAANFVKAHSFGTETELPSSVSINLGSIQSHQFVEWFAYRLENGTPIDVSAEALEKDAIKPVQAKIKADVNYAIYLVPKWKANKFTVTCIDRVGTPDDYKDVTLGTYSEESAAEFGTTVSGKVFGGDREYEGYWFNDSDETLYTTETVGTNGAVVYRYYTPCEYSVTFIINLLPESEKNVTDRGTETIIVTYKEELPQTITVPKCTGLQFLGYYLNGASGKVRYYDSLGNVDENNKTWDLPKDATLFADWEPQKHEVIVNVEDENGTDCSDEVKVEILVKDSANSGTMNYGTKGNVVITVLPGQNKKMTKLDGEAILHTRSITLEFEILESDVTFTIQLLSAEAIPALSVDYSGETLKGFLPGVYRITADDVDLRTVTVAADGSVDADAISLSALFGKTLSVARLGAADQTADSDSQELILKARPVAVQEEKISCAMIETKRARELHCSVDGLQEGYEIAFTTSDDEEPQNWTTDLNLTGLEVGTYSVWLRVRATNNTPHSEATKVGDFEFSHLVDLLPLFIILLCLFVLQLVALAFLLISRYRARMNAVAAPLFAILAVKLIPGGLFAWIVILTIAVIGLQAALVFLALQTSVIWKKRTEKEKDTTSETAPAEFTLFGDEPKPASEEPAKEDEDENRDENENQSE